MESELIEAARQRNSASLRSLILAGQDPDQTDDLGETALTWAAALGHTPIVKDLLAAGADVEKRGRYFGETPLLLAAAGARRGIVSLLAVHADVDARAADGATPLLRALNPAADSDPVVRKVAPVVDVLLAADADPNLADQAGNTPLMAAAGLGDVSLVQRLLDAGADPGRRNKQGESAQSLALRHGHFGVATLLGAH
jgi:ankyrin repeat protein